MNKKLVKIDDLRPHPRQQEIYGAPNPGDYERLKADIAANGLRTPPDVSPDMVILDGHMRVAVLKELGNKEVEVNVEDNLKGDQQELFFVNANLSRRQLNPVVFARLIDRKFRLEKRDQSTWSNRNIQIECRDAIAEQFRISRRTADRYRQLLRLDRYLQDAVERDGLALTTAIKAEPFSKDEHADLQRRFENSENLSSIIKDISSKKSKSIISPKKLIDMTTKLAILLDEWSCVNRLVDGTNLQKLEQLALRIGSVVEDCKKREEEYQKQRQQRNHLRLPGRKAAIGPRVVSSDASI